MYGEHTLENRITVFLLVQTIAQGKIDHEGSLALSVFIAFDLYESHHPTGMKQQGFTAQPLLQPQPAAVSAPCPKQTCMGKHCQPHSAACKAMERVVNN